MWTICWIDEQGNDRWDRLDTRMDLAQFIQENHLVYEAGWIDEDILIFGPDAELDPTEVYELGLRELEEETWGKE